MIESLPVLVLNPHSRCNCRCVMCDIWKAAGVQELTVGGLERLACEDIDRLQVQWVVLTGGEPLLHSGLWRMCAMLHERDIRITLLSSGLLLTRHADSIVEHVDDVIVSLDGPAPVPRCDSRSLLYREPSIYSPRASRGSTRTTTVFPIAARCTVQRSNFPHLTATVEAARGLRLQSISFLASDMESPAFNRPGGWPRDKQSEIALNSYEVSLLEAGIEALIAQGECGKFVLESPVKLRRIVRHFRVHLGEEAPRSPVCNAPWTSAVVDADGAVRPCFFTRPSDSSIPARRWNRY